METRSTTTVLHNTFEDKFTGGFGQYDSVNRRLEVLLAANAETYREKTMYRSHRERLEAEMMRTPLTSEQAFAYLGLLLGTFPPMTILLGILSSMGSTARNNPILIALFIGVNALSAFIGFQAGKVIAGMARSLESRSWTYMLLTSPLLGVFWGLMAGAGGGLVVFGIGAFLGAALGAAVGAVTLPAFMILHRTMKRGDLIDLKHFLPIAFGITYIVCALILRIFT